MCVLSIKVVIRKRSGNLFNDPRTLKSAEVFWTQFHSSHSRWDIVLSCWNKKKTVPGNVSGTNSLKNKICVSQLLRQIPVSLVLLVKLQNTLFTITEPPLAQLSSAWLVPLPHAALSTPKLDHLSKSEGNFPCFSQLHWPLLHCHFTRYVTDKSNSWVDFYKWGLEKRFRIFQDSSGGVNGFKSK